MPPFSISSILQLIVGLGLLNVWLLRASRSTGYRGGEARSLKEEFAVYGLPEWFFHLVGALKILSGVLLVMGLWVPEVVLPAAGLVIALMLGAVSMHLKVNDPAVKSLPATLMLLMAVAIFVLNL
ncbi:MAG: DoxX family protein [Planctomycetota bacterium]